MVMKAVYRGKFTVLFLTTVACNRRVCIYVWLKFSKRGCRGVQIPRGGGGGATSFPGSLPKVTGVLVGFSESDP